ncbi:hypothetical protein Mal35_51950 [Gimesia maris]|nr:hypothetical protein Mal35_51950 [Gimesia maris]
MAKEIKDSSGWKLCSLVDAVCGDNVSGYTLDFLYWAADKNEKPRMDNLFSRALSTLTI